LVDEYNNGRPYGVLDGKISVTFMGIYAKRKMKCCVME